MKVLLPRVQRDTSAFEWKSDDVSTIKFIIYECRKITPLRICSEQAAQKI